MQRSRWQVRYCIILALAYTHLICGCKSFVIQPKSWEYKGHHIGYEEARRLLKGSQFDDRDKNHNPILLLNGFGVGSFHQHRLVPRILLVNGEDEEETNQSRVVYGVDYLGQGRSWPLDCNDGTSKSEEGLIYSADTWLDQLTQFIEEIILTQYQGRPTKVHLVGNSVGGHLAAVLAARRPDLVESLCLLNATPVWGLNLPGWSGHLPPPAIPRKIGRYLFDRIRDLNTIERYLENAYACRDAFGDDLMKQIRGCTEGKGGHAAFASILWSPPATFPNGSSDFFDSLKHVECDTLLIFGKDDPWCKPAFAKKMLQSLSQREHSHMPVSRYVELDNVGHCPNHEAPQAVGKAVCAWVDAKSRSKSDLTLVDGPIEIFQESWAEIRMREMEASEIHVSLLDRIATTFV